MRSYSLCSVFLSFIFIGLVYGKFYTDPSQVAGKTYDYVVVGGGTAGSAVASRLSEAPGVRVLIIEAGVTNDGVVDVIVPFLCAEASPNTPWTWNYTTTAQAGFNNRAITYPRGKLLGGSSSINFMFYTRGSAQEFDRFAKLTGDPGWSWNSLQPYLKKLEHYVAPADGHDTTGQFDPSIHSTTGAVEISLPGFPTELDSRILKTTQELSSAFPFNLDMNSGNTIGVGWAQSTIGQGQRSSSATAYVDTQITTRPNFDVLLQTQVTRLIQSGAKGGLPLFNSVEFAQSAGARRYTVKASREIIVSAGSVNTPQLLMLSGIGDRTALSKLKIPTIVNLPGVGKNLSDHPMLPNQFLVNSTNTFEPVERDAAFAAQLTEQWLTNHTGRLSNTLANHLGWFRLAPNDPIFRSHADPAAGSETSHFEMLYGNGFASWTEAFPTTGNYMTILSTVASPVSRGSITLKTANPFDFPIIDPGFLNSPFDLHVLVESVKSVYKFLSASPWKGYILGPFHPVNLASDAAIETYVKTFTATEWHPVGTASMSPKGASFGVTNPDLTVKGVAGVRVVDASVLPLVPAAHIQAAVYLVAERAADLIKAAND